jgi:glycerol uptake facilitator-like aquaporin
MQNHLSARLLAEFIGTFAFVFIGAGAAAAVGTGAGLNGIAAIAFAHGLDHNGLCLRLRQFVWRPF